MCWVALSRSIRASAEFNSVRTYARYASLSMNWQSHSILVARVGRPFRSSSLLFYFAHGRTRSLGAAVCSTPLSSLRIDEPPCVHQSGPR